MTTKKLMLSILYLFCLMITLTACNGNNETTDSDAEDFVLIISVEETSLPQGENFKVNVELKNNSGEGHEIIHTFLFWPFIPGWDLLRDDGGGIVIDPPQPRSRFFDANSTIRNIGTWGDETEGWHIGFTLEPGTHELSFRAAFSLKLEEGYQHIEVWSNTIMLTVQ